MSWGIFGSERQMGFHQGQSYERNNRKDAENTAAAGIGVAIKGIAAVIEARKDAKATLAVMVALRDALIEIAPDHPLCQLEERRRIYDEVYSGPYTP